MNSYISHATANRGITFDVIAATPLFDTRYHIVRQAIEAYTKFI